MFVSIAYCRTLGSSKRSTKQDGQGQPRQHRFGFGPRLPLGHHQNFRRRLRWCGTGCLATRSWRLSLQPNSVKPTEKEDGVLDGPFAGAFGEWFLTETDVREVLAYRAGMALAALATVAATATAWTEASSHASSPGLMQLPYSVIYEALYWTGVAGLGIALHHIHIYMRPLHRALQYLLGFGAITSGISDVVMWFKDHDLYAHWLITHPLGVITGAGWVAAALTGIFFKEAFCFRRAEASLLFGLVPLLMGGHVLGWWTTPPLSDTGLWISSAIAALMILFSLRKLSQNVQDDLGDKSVFLYQRQRGL
jgi:uncharacterized integral membrane protein